MTNGLKNISLNLNVQLGLSINLVAAGGTGGSPIAALRNLISHLFSHFWRSDRTVERAVLTLVLTPVPLPFVDD